MTQHRPSPRSSIRLVGGVLLASTLTLGAAACGGSDGDTSAPTDRGSTAQGSSAPGTADPGTSSDADAESSGGASATSCVKDSDYLSGTSTVVWTPDGKSEHTVSEVAADKKFALSADDELEPATIEVGVGEVFSVTLAAQAKGISVLKIGCDGGQTMARGVEAGIYITAPGTYAVTAGLGDNPAGTIKVG